MYAQSPAFSYQPSGFSVHPPQTGSWKVNNVLPGIGEDQCFVKQFEKNVLAVKTRPINLIKTVKIPEIRSLLRRSSELIGFFKEHQSSDLSSSQISSIKLELETIQHMIDTSLDDIEKKVKRRARKRLRTRNNRQRWKIEHDETCREAHERTDKWLAEKEAKKLKHKMEKEVKLSAAKALLEVETKESDVIQYIKFVDLLEKLKSHRSEIQHRSAGLTTMEADLKFKSTVKSLQEFLLMRKEEYEKEKKALHVIMEEEVQDRIAAASTATQKLEHKPIIPGGQVGSIIPQVAALLHIRQQWDAFLSPIGNPLPMDPLLPSPPSSADWETYLVSR